MGISRQRSQCPRSRRRCATLWGRYDHARVRDFMPILAEREARACLPVRARSGQAKEGITRETG